MLIYHLKTDSSVTQSLWNGCLYLCAYLQCASHPCQPLLLHTVRKLLELSPIPQTPSQPGVHCSVVTSGLQIKGCHVSLIGVWNPLDSGWSEHSQVPGMLLTPYPQDYGSIAHFKPQKIITKPLVFRASLHGSPVSEVATSSKFSSGSNPLTMSLPSKAL